jgi:hypothetical protein
MVFQARQTGLQRGCFCYHDETPNQKTGAKHIEFTDKGPVDESAIPQRNSDLFEGYRKCASTLPAPDDYKRDIISCILHKDEQHTCPQRMKMSRLD